MDSKNEYWQSCNTGTAIIPKEMEHFFDSIMPSWEQLFQVSIVLDCEARHDFAVIQLLIWHKGLVPLGLEIVGFIYDHDRGRFCSVQDMMHRHKHLASLATKSDKISNDSSVSSRKACTVAFEVGGSSYTRDEIWLQAATPSPKASLFKNNVMFNILYPVSSSNPSLHVLLRFNLKIRPLPTRQFWIPMCNLRILPIATRRRRRGSCVNLPPSIIRHIAMSFNPRDRSWGSNIRSCALVCKAWEHVLGIYFETIFGDYQWTNHSVAHGSHVLRTLRWRPRYGALIRRLDVGQFHDSQVLESSRFHAFWNIMAYARSVSYLSLPVLTPELFRENLRDLCNLREVIEIRVFFSQPSLWTDEDSRSKIVADTQTMITNWKKLNKLSVGVRGRRSGSKIEASKDAHERVFDAKFESKIETLGLDGLFLTGGQLSYFSSSHKLRIINFYSLNGPSNADFRGLLSASASTLEEITVDDCNFPCLDGEEFALDSVMPELVVLRVLSATDSCASTLSLTRKTTRYVPPNSSPLSRSIITIMFENSAVSLRDVEQAVRVPQWDVINIYDKLVGCWSVFRFYDIAQKARIGGLS